MKKLYYIAILPEEKILKEIEGFKLELLDNFALSWALRSPAHITLFPPFHLEEDLISDLKSLVENFNFCFFPIEIGSFDTFDKRVIYVKVGEHHKILKLRDRLAWEIGEFNIKSRDKSFHPHITLASKDIDVNSFDQIWPIFKGRKYKEIISNWKIKILEHHENGWNIL